MFEHRRDTVNRKQYRKFLNAFRQADEEAFQYARQELSVANFALLMERLKTDRPELWKKTKSIMDAPSGWQVMEGEPRRFVNDVAREVFQELKNTYSCDGGFVGKHAKTYGVTIYTKASDAIKGFPKELLTAQTNLLRDVGAKRKWTFSYDNRRFTAHLTIDQIEALKKNPMIHKVEISPVIEIQQRIPIPPYVPGVENVDWGVTRLAPTDAWTAGVKGQGVKICIIDTGVKKTCPDLVDRYKGGWNVIAGDDDPEDDHDHGTYCASIACASENDQGYTGVAPLADLYAVKVLNSLGKGSLNDAATALDWAVLNGMDIVSLSLGSPSGSTLMQEAVADAWVHGVLIVAAAGNENDPSDPYNPCDDDDCVLYPAAYDHVIAVSAIDYDNKLASFSSRGPEIDVAAPGYWIAGSWAGYTYDDHPDTHLDYRIYIDGVPQNYIVASGTSAACPHVAGAAALIKCWYPTATNQEIREYIQDNCVDI